MRNAIIVHGKPTKKEFYDKSTPSESNAHWLPWIQSQLIKRDIHAVTPEMPRPYQPKWDEWVREVERYEIGPETILVGHSCGGGFWVRYLSERPQLTVGKVVLVAPWLDPSGTIKSGFFNFDIDPRIAERTTGLTIFSSDNDMGNVLKSVAEIRQKVEGVHYKEFKGYKHFCYEDMGTDKFPELLSELL